MTEVEWALRDLLWLAAWNASVGPDVADAEIAGRHAQLLEEMVVSVRRQYELTMLVRAKNSPVRTRDGFLLAVADGVSGILKKELGGRAMQISQSPAEIVSLVKLWLDAWQEMAREPVVPRSRIEHVMEHRK